MPMNALDKGMTLRMASSIEILPKWVKTRIFSKKMPENSFVE